MKIQSLTIAIVSISIIVFNNLHQIFTTLTQPIINPLFITGFLMVISGVTIYGYYNRKKLKKWM